MYKSHHILFSSDSTTTANFISCLNNIVQLKIFLSLEALFKISVFKYL